MDVRKLFTQQLNYRYVNQLIDLSQFIGMAAGGNAPTDARVLVEGRGVQVLRITLPKLHNDAEKVCIRTLRKAYPDAVYLFADLPTDTAKTTYHLCNDAGKQLPLTPEKKLLFTDKVKFFEVTDNLTGTLELKERIAKAFETEKITKRFYNEFKNYREKLVKFIHGIPLAEKEDRNWYASVLLNRLMFIYFIQKRGFINGDENWLSRRLAEHEDAKKPFYTDFLMPLFFSGFDKRPGERGAHESAFAGVPYLNGGLFQRHPLEERYPDLSVDNKVLRELLDYFDRYRWYLDDRELHDENEINPDVLGFIFEKYVNQKQMGAYYTKEDITGYICRNTILPFLLTRLANVADGQPAPLPFSIDASNIERFIYDAVKTDAYLPTETEREYAARRKRFEGIKADAAAGKVATVNDLITYNLDIVTYADDAIARMDERALKRFYFEGLTELTVLDPTCGSGAFLFAALNILLPLYTTCLYRMRGFVEGKSKNDARETRAGLTTEYSAFKKELSRIAQHDNERYYIVKSIIVNNLYGVDIMEEATEICKLRLFLRLASEIKDTNQIEPLPDIDFNIKAGNTLVGFANRDDVAHALSTQQRVKDGQVAAQNKMFSGDTLAEDAVAEVERKCADADREFKRYHELQTERNISAEALVQAKHDLRARMNALNNTLDRALAREYGVSLPNEQAEASTKAGKKGKAPLNTLSESAAFVKWKESHQPFHWFAEFYGILVDKGGFDVIVGNPPYVNASLLDYSITNTTYNFPDIYAEVIVSTHHLLHDDGRIGMIVPLSITFSNDFSMLRKAILIDTLSWVSSFDNIPAAVFSGVSQRCTIWLANRTKNPSIYTTRMYRWRAEYREFLVNNITYAQCECSKCVVSGIPKLSSHRAGDWVKMVELCGVKKSDRYIPNDKHAKHYLGVSQAARNFISVFIDEPPCIDSDSLKTSPSSQVGWISLKTTPIRHAALACLCGDLFFWHWLTYGDGFHVTNGVVSSFAVALNGYSESNMWLLEKLGELLNERQNEALSFKKNAGKYVGNYNYRRLPEITRRADMLQMASLGFSKEDVFELFRFVEQVLSINEYAGEKSIPLEVKRKFKPRLVNQNQQQTLFREVDRVLTTHFDFTEDELQTLSNFRMGRDSDEDE